METAGVQIGSIHEVLGWLLAIVIILVGLHELKQFAGFLLLKLYQYFIQH